MVKDVLAYNPSFTNMRCKSGLWPGQKSPILVMLRWALAFDMTTLPWQAVYVGGMVLLSKMRGCHFLTHNRTKFAGEQMKLRHLYIYIHIHEIRSHSERVSSTNLVKIQQMKNDNACGTNGSRIIVVIVIIVSIIMLSI